MIRVWAGTEPVPHAVAGTGFKVAASMMLETDASNYITRDFYFTGIPMATVYSGNSKSLF
jgi:hypothetical protein